MRVTSSSANPAEVCWVTSWRKSITALAKYATLSKSLELKENTLIIFSSDNGPWIKFRDVKDSKYGDTRLQVGYAQPFRDGKGSNWEGGHRVPGIFCWPGTIAPHSVELSPASTLDLLPTVFALAGLETSATDRSASTGVTFGRI